jgi:O-antigen/teichoic acid export membrane protein
VRQRVVRGSFYELVGFGAAQVVRLASNLVTTRLLFPEAFGLMALVGIVLQGVDLFSDVGLQASIVQNKRGDEPAFLDTAWTIQVLRGFLVALAAASLSFPMARFYHEPDLLALVPVACVSMLLGGFNSTSLITLRRHLSVGRLVLLEAAGQVVASLAVIGWALISPSVWALVFGGICRSVLTMVVSHRLEVGHRNRFNLETEAARDVLHFGKWIFLSSSVTFVSKQADRLLLGRFMGMTELGIYSVAVFLSDAFADVLTRLNHGVLFPALSTVTRRDPSRIPSAYYQARLRLDALALPVLGGLSTAGTLIVGILYDPRYHEAGWILQALALRVGFYCTLTSGETCLVAMGHSRYGFYRSAARALWVVVGVPLGWHLAGLPGLVWAMAFSEVPAILVIWPALWGLGVLRLRYEALAVSLFGLGALAGHVLVASGFLHAWVR